MNRWQDISISDASLKAEFITKFFDGDYIDAFTIISNNPQLNTKAFVADTINQIATILLSLENNFQNGVIDYLAQQYLNFQNIIDNYNLRGNWSASTTYQIYNFVTYNNIDYLYINLTPSSGNLPTNTDYWVEINIQGEKGAPGLGVNLQYDWSATTPYNALDVVYYNNALWVARVANINKIPGSTEEWETLSGPIVSFYNDGDIEISNLSVDVEPVQDLHGYDAPWPAGGGKNKLNNTATTTTSNGVTFTVNADGSVSCSGTATGTAVLRIYTNFTIAENVILSGCPSGGDYNTGYSLLAANQNGSAVSGEVSTSVDLGSGVTIQSQYVANIKQIQIIVRTGTNTDGKVFYPMLRLATVTDPTYAPYENLCPISGWNNVVVEADGLNLFDVEKYRTMYSDYDLSVNSYHVKRIPLKPNTTYTVSMDSPVAQSKPILLLNNKSVINDTGYFDCRKAGKLPVTYVTDSTGNLYIGALFSSDAAVSARLDEINLQIELGTTATAYKPYAGNTISRTYPETIYGGKDEVTGDGVTSNDELIIMDGVTNRITGKWEETQYGAALYSTILGERSLFSGAISSVFKKSNEGYARMPLWSFVGGSGASATLSFVFPSGYTVEDANNWLQAQAQAGNPVQILRKRPTPVSIPLDPATVPAIPGQTNNVWADAGDVTVELSKKYWEEFIKFKLASIYTDYIEPSGDSLYNGLIWFEVFNPQNWDYLTNKNYTWNQVNTNNDTWESVDRGDY